MPFVGKPEDLVLIEIVFDAASAGWQPVTFKAGSYNARFIFSHIYCPFDQFIEWLEIIADGGSSRFLADLQGAFAEIFSFQVDDPSKVGIYMCHTCPDGKRFRFVEMDIVIDRFTFVDAFYRAIRIYGQSERYSPDEWAYISLKEDVEKRCPNLKFENLVYYKQATVNELFWNLYPEMRSMFSKYFVTEKTQGGLWQNLMGRKKRFSQRPNMELDEYFPLDFPDYCVTDQWDHWTRKQRLEYLQGMKQDGVSPWDGADFRTLRSLKLEKWLSWKDK